MKIQFTFLAFLSTFLLFLASCTPDPCEDVSCPSDASCEEGLCICTGGAIYNANDNTCNCAVGFVRDSTTGDCVVFVDPCANVDCDNGTCDNGDCDCDDGYEQDSTGSCTVEERAKFVDSYTVQETCNGIGESYTTDIVNSGSGIRDISFDNLYNVNLASRATVDGQSLTIPNQPFGSGTIQGSGTLTNNTMDLQYTVTAAGGGSSSCTATLTKY